MKVPWGVAMIYILRDRSRIIESIAPEASLWVVAAVEVVLTVGVERRRIYWVAAPNFVGSNPLKLCSRDSRPVIGLCYGYGQNG
uniref:Uncharacterized protein n=1 Tax=Romanomermis culicivorax TaxID=13658 RepID=A0A915IIV6_ROMCU